MKKIRFLFALIIVAACCFTVGFAQTTQAYNDALIAQQPEKAQMLYDLGLFRGTDKGFELDKTMTRGEAAVMITRLLGGEKEALEKNYTTPFKDLPEWVAPYVGWLYENKLTSGVSKTEYGTAQNISFEQYVVLLGRHTYPSYSYATIVSGCELASKIEFDENHDIPFLRGTSASLSARFLSVSVTAYANGSYFLSVAQELVDKGTITLQALEQYARPVVGSTFKLIQNSGPPPFRGTIARRVLGVEMERSKRNDYIIVTERAYEYGLATREENSELVLCMVSAIGLREEYQLKLGINADYSSSVAEFIGTSRNFTYAICTSGNATASIIRYNSDGIEFVIDTLSNGGGGKAVNSCVSNDMIAITSEEGTYIINRNTDICTKFSSERRYGLCASSDKIYYLPDKNMTKEGFDDGTSTIFSVDSNFVIETALSLDASVDIPISGISSVKDNVICFYAGGCSDKTGFQLLYRYDGKRIYLDDAWFATFTSFPNFTSREKAIRDERARLDELYK